MKRADGKPQQWGVVKAFLHGLVPGQWGISPSNANTLRTQAYRYNIGPLIMRKHRNRLLVLRLPPFPK